MKRIIAMFVLALLTSLSVSGEALYQRNDTIVPKLLINGYFFREMPDLPKAQEAYYSVRDSAGNKMLSIKYGAELPQSAIKQAIPKEQVRNAEQFLKSDNLMRMMQEVTTANMKPDGTSYSPKVGEPFPAFTEKDMDGRIWTNADVKGKVMVLNLWYSGCGPCRAEMPELSTWKEQLPDVMFFSATFHDAETAKRITDKHHFTWTHLVEARDMLAWIGHNGFPLTIVVDKHGIVRYSVNGTNKTKRAQLLAKIKEASDEQ